MLHDVFGKDPDGGVGDADRLLVVGDAKRRDLACGVDRHFNRHRTVVALSRGLVGARLGGERRTARKSQSRRDGRRRDREFRCHGFSFGQRFSDFMLQGEFLLQKSQIYTETGASFPKFSSCER